jgi:hypothetical protein
VTITLTIFLIPYRVSALRRIFVFALAHSSSGRRGLEPAGGAHRLKNPIAGSPRNPAIQVSDASDQRLLRSRNGSAMSPQGSCSQQHFSRSHSIGTIVVPGSGGLLNAAGNRTIPGSAATLIVLEPARREDVDIALLEYSKVGAPVMVVTLAAAWL